MDAQENRELAKRILLEILQQNDGRMEGKTRLYKAFYFAHLFYYKNGHGLLSDWPIVHMPNGPGIDQGMNILEELEKDGLIRVSSQQSGPYDQAMYQLQALAATNLGNDAIDAIAEAVRFVDGKSGADLSEITHEFSRSWNAGQPGEPLNIYIDLLNDKEYERATAEIDEISQDVAAVFGT